MFLGLNKARILWRRIGEEQSVSEAFISPLICLSNFFLGIVTCNFLNRLLVPLGIHSDLYEGCMKPQADGQNAPLRAFLLLKDLWGALFLY